MSEEEVDKLRRQKFSEYIDETIEAFLESFNLNDFLKSEDIWDKENLKFYNEEDEKFFTEIIKLPYLNWDKILRSE